MGLWMVQCKALIKRKYLIKTRYWNAMIWELVLPIAFMIMFGAINLASPDQKKPPTTEWDKENLNSFSNVTSNFELLVSPNTSETYQIAKAVSGRIGCNFSMFTNEASAESGYSVPGESTKIGVLFGSDITDYTLRFTKGAVPLDLFSYNPADCSYNINNCPALQYTRSGMGSLQAAIDAQVIKLLNATFVPPVLQSQLMPENRDVIYVDGTLRMMFPFYFIYAMGFIAMFLSYAAVDDKVKGRRDHLTMMGMRPSAYWAAWCVINLPLSAVISVAGVLILLAFDFFSTPGAYLFFFAAVVVYSLNNILIGVCWSTILPKTDFIFASLLGTTALGAVGLVNILLTDYITDASDPKSPPVISVIVCFIPPAGMATLLERMFVLDRRYPDGLVTGAFTAGNLPLVAILGILVFDILLWAVIAMWLEGVLPNTLGGRLPLCFCLDKKYWNPDPIDPNAVKSYEMSVEIDEEADVEPVARSMHGKEAIRLFNIKKDFVQSNGCGKTEVVSAVKGLSLDIYEGQITALLGHNGAGKTTLINMMTGIMPVTSGTATLYGYDISNAVDLQSIRQMIGICPQKDVIVERLTVREHLELYAHLKGIPEEEIVDKINQTVADCDLTEKIDTGAEKLSGGQKRKLNLAMALIGDPKVLFLDEPTAGMDPYSRRHVWSLLKRIRAEKVILLTTHFMDEADVLADRKAVIAKGKLQCAGSSLYLKNKFGVGYQLTLLLEAVSKQDELTAAIVEVVEDSTHKRTYGNEVTYNLPIRNSIKFSDLFSMLDAHKEQFSIASYSIAMITLEEVFLKLGEQAEEEERLEKERREGRRGDIDNTVRPQTFELDDADNPINMVKEKVATDRLRLWFMVKQRLRMIPREGMVIVSMIIYVIMVAVGVLLIVISSDGIGRSSEPRNVTLDVVGSTFTRDPSFMSHSILYYNNTSGNIDDLVDSLNSVVQPSFTLQTYNGNYANPTPPVAPYGYDVHNFTSVTADSDIYVRHNHSYLLSLPLSLNVLSSCLLSMATSNISSALTTTLSEWPSADAKVYTFNTGSFSGMAFVFAIYIGSTFYTISIVGEREKKLKPLFRTAGVSVNTYFGTYLLLYLLLLGPVLLIAVIVIIAWPVAAFKAPLAAVLFVLHMFIQLVLVVLLSFCWSYAFQRAQTAGNISNINIWGTLLFFTPVSILINIQSTRNVAMVLHHIFCFAVPYYSFPGGLLMFFEAYRSYLIDVGDENEVVPSIAYIEPKRGVPSALIGGALWVFLLFVFLRIGEIRVSEGKISDVFKCFSNHLSRYNPSALNDDDIADEDDDVLAEREKVSQLWQQQQSQSKVVMKAVSLRKEFAKGKDKSMKVAVRNMTFHVEEGQVFGLLGPNGAGKTTALNMIIAELSPTAGQVMVDDIEVHSALSEAFELIGYCPQFDALWPAATPSELMIFFGISSGLSETQATTAANYYIKMLKIEEHRDKYTKNLSGGTQRKVSFALALMGWPRLVLLDEPSTGLDPSSKRFLWNTIRSSFNGHKRSAILTTHYMEEADALCTRIGIMVNGALECIGSGQHLKNKYGDGYHLEVKLKESEDGGGLAMTNLKQFVEETFPQSTVIEQFADRIQYAMPTTVVESPGQVFAALELNKERLLVEEYSFSQSTLEQVFIQFAKQQLQADEDEENAEVARQKSRGIFQKQKSVNSGIGADDTDL